MSQQLTPVNGGVVPEVQATTAPERLNVLSPQYISVNALESRPTEWVADGRPIYRRLPAISETYQVDFFNVSPTGEVEDFGYVYVPYNESTTGPTSAQVVAAEGNGALLIKGGNLIWRYGKNTVLPAIIDLEVLEVGAGSYDLAYQLIYDNTASSLLYSAEDYSLAGTPLTITSGTDAVVGWRYLPANAFLNDSNLYWSNEDTFFPDNPVTAYLQWETEAAQAYSKVVLRCPPGTSYQGSATLSYVMGTTALPTQTATVSSDSIGQYFEFKIADPVFHTKWDVTFSSPKVSIQSVSITGTITRTEVAAEPTPRATLVMYPEGTLPQTVTNADGEEVPASYCQLATVKVDSRFQVSDIRDTRVIFSKDYAPVADWLTSAFDQNLIDLYEQVSGYSTLWMSPPTALIGEYATLSTDQITVEA